MKNVVHIKDKVQYFTAYNMNWVESLNEVTER